MWAGLSATAATLACAALLLGMAYFATPGRDDSLAGIIDAMAEPVVDARARADHVAGDIVPVSLASATEQDLVFALAAVVTQEGRVSRSQAQVQLAKRADRETVLRLMNAAVASRFQPVRLGVSPVPSNLVWLAQWTGGVRLYGVTHTTVRGKALS